MIFGNLLWLFILMSVWSALYQGRTSVNGIQLNDMITYVLLGSVIAALTRANIIRKMSDKIVDGSVAVDFVRPISYKYYNIADELGEYLFQLLLGSIPPVIIIAAFYGFALPQNPISLLLFFISFVNAVVLNILFTYTLGLSVFWLKTPYLPFWFYFSFREVFGGTVVPLWFYPEVLRKIARFLPWRLLTFDPLQIYLEKITIPESIRVILLQLAWIIVTFVLEKIIWTRARRVVTVQGG